MVILFPTTFGDDFRASFNAFVTDEYTWTCNQLPNAILRIGAEGASEVRVLLVSVVSASEHVCLPDGLPISRAEASVFCEPRERDAAWPPSASAASACYAVGRARRNRSTFRRSTVGAE